MKILKSRKELLIHLTSDGTCKCGLRCPFQFEEQFSFDPHVLSLPDNGIPSVIQASCKVGHALRDLMSKPDGAREPRGEKVSTMEGSVSEPKLHRHRIRSRSHRKKPSGKRMPENENEGNGNAIVPTARAVLLSTSEKAEKNSARSDGKQSDIVKTSVLESPTRPQDAAASSWSPDMNVRRLLTQLPGNSSPSLQRGMRVGERKLSENTEDRQKPSKVTLRLFQKQKESKVHVSEKQSLALSAVLTGRTISELTRKSGRGMTQGGGEVDVGEEAREGETECELTVSIKLGESEGQKGVEDKEMQSKRDDPLQLTTSDGAEAEDSDLPKDSQSVLGELGNGGMEVLESDSGNHECLYTNKVISTEMHVASITENLSQVSSPSFTSSDDSQIGSHISQLSEAVPAIQSLQSHTNQVAPPPTSPPSSNTRPTPSNHLLGSAASTSTSSLLSYTLPPGPGVAGQFLTTPTDFLPPSSSVPYTPYPLQSSPTKHTSPSLSTFVVEHSSPPTPSTNLPSLPHVEPQTTSRIPPPPYPSCAGITPMNSGPVNPQSSSSSQPLSAKTGSQEVSTLPDSEQPQPLPLQFHAEAGDLSLVLSSQPDVVDVAHGSQEEEVENGMEQNVLSLDRLISELCGMEVEGNGSVNGALQLLASEDSQVTSAVIDDDHHGNFSSPIGAHSTLGSDGAVQVRFMVVSQSGSRMRLRQLDMSERR